MSSLNDDVVSTEFTDTEHDEDAQTVVSSEDGSSIRTTPRYNLRDRARLPVPRYLLMTTESEPSSFEEAMNSHDGEKWLKSMEEKMSSLYENKIFQLT